MLSKKDELLFLFLIMIVSTQLAKSRHTSDRDSWQCNYDCTIYNKIDIEIWPSAIRFDKIIVYKQVLKHRCKSLPDNKLHTDTLC